MTSLLKISEAATLALHAMTYLAQKPGELVGAKELAAAMDASAAHIQKVMQRLNKEGFVAASRGPKGGFTLIKDPAEITLMDIFSVIEGRTDSNDCLFKKRACAHCHNEGYCIFGDFFKSMNRKFTDYLNNTRLQTLVSECAKGGEEQILKCGQ